MRIGICEWTTFPASFEQELAACRAAGAEAIGILEFKLDGVDDVRGRLREAGLAASACLPAAGSILPSPLDVEVMSDDGTFGSSFDDSPWALPVEEIARRSVASLEALA